jgi:hypothetical protein
LVDAFIRWGSVSQQQLPARQGATPASTAPDLAQRYTIPAASALDYQANITAYNQSSHWGYYGMGSYYGRLGGYGWYGGLGSYGWYGGGMAGWWNPWWYGAYRWLADPDEPALDPGFWNLRGAVDKILAAGSQYAGGYDSHPFELLDTAWLPIAPAQLPNADASSSAEPSAPNEPGSSLSGLAFGVLNAALGSGVALTVATAALGGASEAPAESSTRAWNRGRSAYRLETYRRGCATISGTIRKHRPCGLDELALVLASSNSVSTNPAREFQWKHRFGRHHAGLVVCPVHLRHRLGSREGCSLSTG